MRWTTYPKSPIRALRGTDHCSVAAREALLGHGLWRPVPHWLTTPAASPRSTCTPTSLLRKLTHSTPPASPYLASSCALDSPGKVLSVMPDPGARRLGHTVHQVHCGPFPRQSLGRSAAWEWCVCRLDPLQPPCCKIPLESNTCSSHSSPDDNLLSCLRTALLSRSPALKALAKATEEDPARATLEPASK